MESIDDVNHFLDGVIYTLVASLGGRVGSDIDFFATSSLPGPLDLKEAAVACLLAWVRVRTKFVPYSNTTTTTTTIARRSG